MFEKHFTAPTRFVEAEGRRFAYRRWGRPVAANYIDAPGDTIDVGGPDRGTPVIFLQHLAAVLDNWDPRIVDGIAAEALACPPLYRSTAG